MGWKYCLTNLLTEQIDLLDQDLGNLHADYTYERNGCRHWENTAQNFQRERDTARRNAYRMTVHYNTDIKHWRRRYAGCINQARNWKGRYQNTHI